MYWLKLSGWTKSYIVRAWRFGMLCTHTGWSILSRKGVLLNSWYSTHLYRVVEGTSCGSTGCWIYCFRHRHKYCSCHTADVDTEFEKKTFHIKKANDIETIFYSFINMFITLLLFILKCVHLESIMYKKIWHIILFMMISTYKIYLWMNEIHWFILSWRFVYL